MVRLNAACGRAPRALGVSAPATARSACCTLRGSATRDEARSVCALRVSAPAPHAPRVRVAPNSRLRQTRRDSGPPGPTDLQSDSASASFERRIPPSLAWILRVIRLRGKSDPSRAMDPQSDSEDIHPWDVLSRRADVDPFPLISHSPDLRLQSWVGDRWA
jgi:hypothetical protein